MSLFIKKAMDEERKVLNQTLGAIDLTLLGIGAIIGTGIFVLTGIVARNMHRRLYYLLY